MSTEKSPRELQQANIKADFENAAKNYAGTATRKYSPAEIEATFLSGVTITCDFLISADGHPLVDPHIIKAAVLDICRERGWPTTTSEEDKQT